LLAVNLWRRRAVRLGRSGDHDDEQSDERGNPKDGLSPDRALPLHEPSRKQRFRTLE